MFRIHRAERADALVDALVDRLAEVPADPFTPEIVAVPTRGVERWLTHRIGAAVGTSPGRADGVCANVEFPFPGRLVGDVLAEVTGVDRTEDPWRPERLVWPVLEVLDANGGAPWLALLVEHLGTREADDTGDGGGDGTDDDLRRARRFATARHLADLFDSYAVYRPGMVLDWNRGGDGDGFGRPLPIDATWQAELWRRVREVVASPSPAERVEGACRRLRAGDVAAIDAVLPRRISLFGLTRLPATYLEVLRALAVHRDVHLYALHPSLALWERVAATAPPSLPIARHEDPTRDLPRHPLLRTWGTDSREMQLVLSEAADAELAHHPLGESAAAGRSTTLLGRIQSDVRHDREPTADHVLAGDDRTVQIHACHGRSRQVEVVRDAICHLLADDPTLEPRDVIVMCPDIDEFAPLLHATFGPPLDQDEAGETGSVPALPYRLADRSLRQTNPLLGTLADLLALVEGRLTAPEVIDFAGREPVRQRFGFDDRELERIARWTATSGIRWGLDAARRRDFWLGEVEANTWRSGIDRVLLGVTMDEDGSRLVGGRLPLDDVDSGDIDLAGRFAELVDRVDTVATDCSGRCDVGEWVAILARATDLLLGTSPAQAWQRAQVDRVLRDVLGEATRDDAVASSPLSLPEVRALLADRLRGMPTRADFRTGAITMCTLVPMRAVPHRVVCVLGLDDGTFPRTGRAEGDDLLHRLPLVGDRDARAEDRQLLLDALLSATEHLVVTYSGHDERTNEPRPPAVPLSELVDVVDRTAHTAEGAPASGQVVVHHPLQPFDPRVFAVEPVGGTDPRRAPWGFDANQLAGARAVIGSRVRPAAFLDEPLPLTPAADVVLLDDLVRFVQHPVRELLRQQLGVNVWDDDDHLLDAIPVELDGLERWGVGQRLLDRLLAGEDVERVVDAELARGFLPPSAMGRAAVGSIRQTAERILDVARAVDAAGTTESIEVDVEAGGSAVVGTVPGLRAQATTSVSFSSIGAKHRLAGWVRLVALSAAHPDQPWRAVTVGRARGTGRVVQHTAFDGPAGARLEAARAVLADLVDLRRRGLRDVLPLPCATAEAWASARRRGRSPEAAARKEWETGYRFPKEDRDRSHQRAFGGVISLEQVLAMRPREDECGEGWAMDEPTRLGRLARRLWDPLLDREVWP